MKNLPQWLLKLRPFTARTVSPRQLYEDLREMYLAGCTCHRRTFPKCFLAGIVRSSSLPGYRLETIFSMMDNHLDEICQFFAEKYPDPPASSGVVA